MLNPIRVSVRRRNTENNESSSTKEGEEESQGVCGWRVGWSSMMTAEVVRQVEGRRVFDYLQRHTSKHPEDNFQPCTNRMYLQICIMIR